MIGEGGVGILRDTSFFLLYMSNGNLFVFLSNGWNVIFFSR